MGFLVNLIFSALLVTLGVYLYRKKTREKRINAYFCTAVRVYALTDEEDVRIAILTAAKAAAKKQRDSMVKYLKTMASDIKNMTEIDLKIYRDETRIEIEKLLAWREFYLQGKITWDNLQLALKQKDEGIEPRIEIPIANTFSAIRVNYKIQKLL